MIIKVLSRRGVNGMGDLMTTCPSAEVQVFLSDPLFPRETAQITFRVAYFLPEGPFWIVSSLEAQFQQHYAAKLGNFYLLEGDRHRVLAAVTHVQLAVIAAMRRGVVR